MTPLSLMSTEVMSHVREYLQHRMEKERIPAIAYAVLSGDELIHADALGIANLEWEIPATADTAFQLASATKPLAGTLLMMCVERGEINLDASIAEYLPETPAAWIGITVRQLVTHTSGLSDDVTQTAQREGGVGKDGKETTVTDIVEAAAKLPLAYEPGSKSQYGLTDFVVLMAILEMVTGKEFQSLLRERLFEPLGMISTRYDNATDHGGSRSMDILPRRASVYRVVDGALRDFKFFYPKWSYAAGGLYSSVADLSKWLIVLERGELLRPETMQEMWTPERLTSGEDGLFSPGWVVFKHRGRPTVGHSGGPALGDIMWFRDDGVKVVVLCNLQGPLPDLAPGVADVVHKRNSYAAAQAALEAGAGVNRAEPSHALESYVGEFEHPEHGALAVRLGGPALALDYGGRTFPLSHLRDDVFVWNEGGAAGRVPVSFMLGQDGAVERIVVALGSDARLTEFERSRDRSMRERSFLERFVGEYELMGATLVISMEGEDQLQATIPGQPPLILDPFRGTSFTVNGAVGTTVEFQLDDHGNVTGAALRQPMGEVVAQRRQGIAQ